MPFCPQFDQFAEHLRIMIHPVLGQVIEKELDLQQLGVPLHCQRVGSLVGAQHGTLLGAGQLPVMKAQQLKPVQTQQS